MGKMRIARPGPGLTTLGSGSSHGNKRVMKSSSRSSRTSSPICVLTRLCLIRLITIGTVNHNDCQLDILYFASIPTLPTRSQRFLGLVNKPIAKNILNSSDLLLFNLPLKVDLRHHPSDTPSIYFGVPAVP